MSTVAGVDYAWSHPSPAALAAAGKHFAARYLSHDVSKSLTLAEAQALAADDIWSAVVFEDGASRALAGRAGGVADATTAAAKATAAGMPPGRPIYFAVDFETTAAQRIVVNSYLDGAASVIGPTRVGVYGGYDTVKSALDGGHAHWGWQTLAWSAGRWDPRAVIRQGLQQTIGGVSCDLDTAYAADYGQWMPGGKTPLEEDVPLTDAEMEKISTLNATKVLAALGAPAGVLARIDNPTVADDPKNPAADDESVRALWWDMGMHAGRADANSTKILAQIGALQGVLTQLLGAVKAGSVLTPEQAVAAAETGADAALAKLGDALTTPKES